MATQHDLSTRSFKAGADLSAAQYHIMELSATDTVTTCNDAADVPIGILQNDPGVNQAATVARGGKGVSKVVSDGSGTAIAVGDFIGTNASGRGVKKTANNDWIVGRALDASSANGVVIRVDLTYFGQLGA